MSLALITEFIAAVNTQLLKGKKAAELNALWQTISSVPKCPALVKAGKREGETCGKSCVKGQPFCLCHTPREVVAHDDCSFILTAGKREGQTCGKSCPVGQMCTAHQRVIVPCEYILKNGDRQGQACGVTCASGTICKKHIKKATEEIVEEAVQEIEDAQVQVQAQVAALAAAEEKENADEIIDNLLEEIADDIIGVLVEEQAIDHHDEIANDIIDVLVEERSAPFGVPERVPIAVAAVATCGAILKSGINKGKACGKNCVSGTMACSAHRGVSPPHDEK